MVPQSHVFEKIVENSRIHLRCQRRFMRGFRFQLALLTAKPLAPSHAHVLKAWSRFPLGVRKWKPIDRFHMTSRRPYLCTNMLTPRDAYICCTFHSSLVNWWLTKGFLSIGISHHWWKLQVIYWRPLIIYDTDEGNEIKVTRAKRAEL